MILDTIVENRLLKLKNIKNTEYYKNIMKGDFKKEVRNFKAAFAKGNIGVIGEIKKASPSKGVIVEDFNVEEISKLYEKINIDAISVLTEESFFMGSLENIKIANKNTSKPILRKDFIVDKFQLYETRYYGADAVLLIAAVLKKDLKNYFEEAKNLGLNSLIEVHNEEELYEALNCQGEIIGINNRDLKTFKVDMSITEKIMLKMPKEKLVISESGVMDAAGIGYLKAMGVKGLLIGEGFMRRLYDYEKMKEFLEAIKNS
ncbi:indole-3-glycerol phosphate synthase TrpC [Clostridium sp. 19966]|uniref:indole-3-glycerol phosphate synthase TrpC n=1 Tax=Clostridium sp. 19966 TaxID=2768166 RepID=UPI0028DFA175|nr:indole-3-glycerol phosphate synthase TrpC [Clostridium sp. 19966]MDT8717091.1 indole-3-glycerol phosphate synthase TrpC [Clostridium sp. 19966]